MGKWNVKRFVFGFGFMGNCYSSEVDEQFQRQQQNGQSVNNNSGMSSSVFVLL